MPSILIIIVIIKTSFASKSSEKKFSNLLQEKAPKICQLIGRKYYGIHQSFTKINKMIMKLIKLILSDKPTNSPFVHEKKEERRNREICQLGNRKNVLFPKLNINVVFRT